MNDEINWLGERDLTESALAGWIGYGRRYEKHLRGKGRADEADSVKDRTELVLAAHQELVAIRTANRVIPIRWLSGAKADDISAAISAPALRKVADMDLDGKHNVVLLGGTGIGKSTALALAVRRYHVRTAYRVEHLIGLQFPKIVWTYARDIVAATQAHPLGKGEAPMVEDAKKAALLVLDDIGLERDAGPLLDVLHYRYTAGKPTWSTSGFTLAQLTEKFGDAFVRRLVELNGKPGIVVSAFPRANLKAV